MSVTQRVVRVQMRRPVGPGIKDSTVTDYHKTDPGHETDEAAKAYGENIARKHKLAADGWIPNVTVMTEAEFWKEVHCG